MIVSNDLCTALNSDSKYAKTNRFESRVHLNLRRILHGTKVTCHFVNRDTFQVYTPCVTAGLTC